MCCNTDGKEGVAVPEIKKDRGCTDILFLLAFVASWIAIIIVISKASQAGADPNRIVRGVDYTGKICGKDGREKTPLAAWPNPHYYEYQVCVETCDETSNQQSKVMAVLYPSTAFLYYCLPNPATYLNMSVSAAFNTGATAAQNAFADLFTAWVIILISPFIALIVTFIVVALIRRYAGVLVLFCFLLVIAGLVMAGSALLSAAADADSSISTERAKAIKGCGIACFVAVAVLILLAIFFRTRIRIAVNVVEVAAAAINDMKSLLFFPLIPFIIAVGYFVWWVFVAVFLFSVSANTSAATPSEVRQKQMLSLIPWPQAVYSQAIADAVLAGDSPLDAQEYMPIVNYPSPSYYAPVNASQFAFDENWRPALAYHFFHLLWNTQFLYYFGYLVFAGATADWYFSPTAANGDDKQVALAPVTRSALRTIRYHLGTVAVTSLIIAIIQFIRYVVTYIQKKTRSKPPNKIQECVFCLIQCCLKCVECCMDKINKNALIWTAIYGDGFFTAACSSFLLIWKNLARVAAVNMVSGLVLFIAKLAVMAGTAGIAALVLTRNSTYKADISSPALPTFLIAVIAWTVVSGFMIVFSGVIDTIFFCFLVDEDANKGKAGGGMRAPKKLKEIVEKYSDDSRKEFDNISQAREERGGKVAPLPNETKGAGTGSGKTRS